MDRFMNITAVAGGFTTEVGYINGLGYANILSRTFTESFPMIAVSRVAERADFTVRIRAAQ